MDSDNEKLKVKNNCVLSKKETIKDSGLYGLYFGLGIFNEENSIIPSNIGSIYSYAFYGARCKKITIPKSITYIDRAAFAYCSDIEDFEVEEGNTNYEVKEHSLIDKAKGAFMCGTKNSNIPIDSSITKIELYAFNGINKTGTLNIPSNITSFRPYGSTSSCFKDSGIQKVTFDQNVNLDSDGFNNAFYGASKLEEVDIPNGIKLSYPDNCFDDCTSLKKVIFKSTITNNNLNRKSFKDSQNKIEFIFGDKNTDWSEDNGYVIYNDSSNGKILKGYFGTEENVTLPKVVKIDNYSFYNSKVKKVIMSETITSIGDYSFQYSSLETISFSSSLTFMGTYCFANCNNLKTIKWPSSFTNIQIYSFYNSNLESLVLASNTTLLSMSLNKASIKELRIDGDNPNYIVSDDKLTLLSKDGKTAVASFSDENGTVTIPESVTYVGDYACIGSSVKKLILPVNVESCGKQSFGHSEVENIEIKNPNIIFTKDSGSNYISTFYDVKYLNSITFYGTLDQFKTVFGSTKEEYKKLISKSITVKYKSSADVEIPDTTKTTDEIYA